ncbi:MAG: Fic family protein [Candidatus Thermoplasmatota archaeon]|nr:Fic family protein [Candidatus Thermoplasmatota archaeon]
MVTLRERKRNGITYYYLEHSFRKGGRVEKRERYLGNSIPDDIDVIKNGLIHDIYRERWFEDIDLIGENYKGRVASLPPSALEKAVSDFTIRFTYNTNRIEGSTLTLRETGELLGNGISPGSRPMTDIREAEAHRDTFLEMLESKKDLSMQTLLYFHRELLKQTKKDIAGKLRGHQVAISGSRFMPPMPVEIYPLLTESFNWYKTEKTDIHPVELAGLVHLKLVTIHPFADGNGRIGRLMMNMVLHGSNYPMLDIPYEKRMGYYRALERSQTSEDDHVFLQWFFKRYIAENERYLN